MASGKSRSTDEAKARVAQFLEEWIDELRITLKEIEVVLESTTQEEAV